MLSKSVVAILELNCLAAYLRKINQDKF